MDKIAALSAILEQNPTDSFARYGLAMAFAAEGRTDDALREFGITLQTNPDYVPAHQMTAQTLLKLGQTEAARERLVAGIGAAERTGNAHAAGEMQAMLDDLS